MKKFLFLLMAFAFLATFSCRKDESGKNVNSGVPNIEGISGVKKEYELEQFANLAIYPEVKFSNGDEKDIRYEWSINYKVVSQKKNLEFRIDEIGTFDGYFMALSSAGAKIVEFKIRVSSPSYDKGLILLSEVDGKSVLTFKRLDKMDFPAVPYVFANNNPGAVLGKVPLDVYWKGNTLTNLGFPPTKAQDLEIVVCTADPVKVYTLNYDDMKIRNEIIYDGEGEFYPAAVLCPHGVQNYLWNGIELTFTGKGKEYLMSSSKNFIKPSYKLPAGCELAPVTCSGYTQYGIMERLCYDNANKKMIYIEPGREETLTLGDKFCGVEAMALIPCGAEYRDKSSRCRYEPYKVMLVGSNGDQVKIYVFSIIWSEVEEETLEKEIDATGNILPVSAVCVNPIKPLLYYSKGNSIYRLNYDGGNFDNKPYFSLNENMEIKQMTFCEYDPDTMYIAAEDKSETGSMKASIYVFDISKDTEARQLFEGNKVGGKVKKLVYKGNGLEYEIQMNKQ